MPPPEPDINDKFVQHLRSQNKTTTSFACVYCEDRRIFQTSQELWRHAQSTHQEKLPEDAEELLRFRKTYEASSASKKPNNEDFQPRKQTPAGRHPESGSSSKRPLDAQTTRSLSGLGVGSLSIEAREEGLTGDSHEANIQNLPRKKAAVGDGISAGSASPFRDTSRSPPPTSSEADSRRHPNSELQRPPAGRKTLWTPDSDSPYQRGTVDPSNIASVQVSRSRAQGLQPKARKPFNSPPKGSAPRQQPFRSQKSGMPTSKSFSSPITQAPTPKDEDQSLLPQPETRPISQEQLVAEVKGIYAGLVMVEAKCIEVDNKQATLAQADPTTRPKLNNEQWQALIALHRTLLHEHHDFFLASQHPSASPALRRLASKYAMPARMWRHGIHSFLELLRHRLPASLDHMLAFIYLAYSMMALLYETVPAFEDTWIECLGDLGRYRMAIEDDDIRDREVWTGVSKHWYSKASDKAPTTGRLCHHLAILARPDTLKQLFYYAKSLCVQTPFVSARESILTLFDPVIATENAQTHFRLPPLDTAFIRAHGYLFTNRDMDKFDPTVTQFTELLDAQIGRVTAKFLVQGYQIAIANSVALLGFGSKENVLMKAMLPSPETADITMGGTDEDSPQMASFKAARLLHHCTLEVILARLGDPNVLSFLHVTLVFIYRMSRHPAAMSLIDPGFPWESLAVFLNTLLANNDTNRIEDDKFPLPEKGDLRPFPEDFGLRGLLFVDQYFPDAWFDNQETDEDEKDKDKPSMFVQRKERIMWLGRKITKAGSWLTYDSAKRHFSPIGDIDLLQSRTSTFASATTIDRSETWPTMETDVPSDAEEEMASATMSAEAGEIE